MADKITLENGQLVVSNHPIIPLLKGMALTTFGKMRVLSLMPLLKKLSRSGKLNGMSF